MSARRTPNGDDQQGASLRPAASLRFPFAKPHRCWQVPYGLHACRLYAEHHHWPLAMRQRGLPTRHDNRTRKTHEGKSWKQAPGWAAQQPGRFSSRPVPAVRAGLIASVVSMGSKGGLGNLVFPWRAVCGAKTDRRLTRELHLCNLGKNGGGLRQTNAAKWRMLRGRP